jgi:hypothetical protein
LGGRCVCRDYEDCVAVIAQQIYARHVLGLTSDPRFGGLGVVVKALARAAEHAAERGVV